MSKLFILIILCLSGCIRYQLPPEPVNWTGPATVTGACPDVSGSYLLSDFELLSNGDRASITTKDLKETIVGRVMHPLIVKNGEVPRAGVESDVITITQSHCQHIQIEAFDDILQSYEKTILSSESYDDRELVFPDLAARNKIEDLLIGTESNTIRFARDENGCLLLKRDARLVGISNYVMPTVEVEGSGWILLPRVNEHGQREINCDL